MNNKSFTLIELLVVIVIIGILAGVIMISTSSSIDKANLAKAQAFSKTVQNELLLNLISEWTFDEDVSPYNSSKDTWGTNTGTVVGADYNSSNCISGGCYDFNGTSDYIDLNNNFLSLAESSTKTISGWFKSDTVNISVSTARILTLHKASGSSGFSLMIYNDSTTNDHIALYYCTSSALTILNSNIKVSKNWMHVVGVQNGTSVKIYVNGAEANSVNNGGIFGVSTPTNAIIGAFSVGPAEYFLDGLIDEVRIYDAALSSAQIKQNYIAGLDSLLSKGSISKEDYNQRINALAYDN